MYLHGFCKVVTSAFELYKEQTKDVPAWIL